MGQQFCCGNRVKLPDLDKDLHITNEQLIEEIKDLREQHKEDIESSAISMQGEAIFRGKVQSNQLKHGYGEYYFRHYVYFGMFEKDQPNGHGLAIKDDYTYYRGNFKNQDFDGFGKEYGSDYSFEGEFERGFRKNGIFKNDKFEYRGSFKGNLFQGEGVIVFANGTSYEGCFKRGQIAGKGVLVFPNGKIYKGELQHGKCTNGRFSWKPEVRPLDKHANQLTEEREPILADDPTESLLELLRRPSRRKDHKGMMKACPETNFPSSTSLKI